MFEDNTTNYILVLTNVGEECDDESALWYLYKKAVEKPSLMIEVLCVGGKINEQDRVRRVYDYILAGQEVVSNFVVGVVSEGPKHVPHDNDILTRRTPKRSICRTILHIGPLETENQAIMILNKIIGGYNYVLMGKFGTTNSAQGETMDAAKYLYTHTEKKTIIHTKIDGYTTIPLFSYHSSVLFPPKVQSEILRVGFKNTIGRAPPHLQILNQLVQSGGANYETTKSIHNGIVKDKGPLFDKLIPTKKTIKAAYNYNNKYTPLQIEGMSKMLTSFEYLFDLPSTIIWQSSDPALSEYSIGNGKLSEPFNKFYDTMKNSPFIGLTLAYDLVAAWYVISSLYNTATIDNYFVSIPCTNEVHLESLICDVTLIKMIME
jgi:hypothetical protein